jgi:hypothetical protein
MYLKICAGFPLLVADLCSLPDFVEFGPFQTHRLTNRIGPPLSTGIIDIHAQTVVSVTRHALVARGANRQSHFRLVHFGQPPGDGVLVRQFTDANVLLLAALTIANPLPPALADFFVFSLYGFWAREFNMDIGRLAVASTVGIVTATTASQNDFGYHFRVTGWTVHTYQLWYPRSEAFGHFIPAALPWRV